MSTSALGNHFDIHGGGMDLKFPHHENEIAQSCGATHEQFVNIWMHNGFVQVAEEKMSKSLGNFFTIRDVLKEHRAEVVRYFVLSRHYRSPMNFTEDDLDRARAAVDGLYTALRGIRPAAGPDEITLGRFRQVMDDDFNTAEGFAVLKGAASELNKARNAGDENRAACLAAAMIEIGRVLGLLQEDPDAWLKGLKAEPGVASLKTETHQPSVSLAHDGLSEDEIESRIQARNEARRNKNWAEADRIRDELAVAGVILEDGPTGTDWRRG